MRMTPVGRTLQSVVREAPRNFWGNRKDHKISSAEGLWRLPGGGPRKPLQVEGVGLRRGHVRAVGTEGLHQVVAGRWSCVILECHVAAAPGR